MFAGRGDFHALASMYYSMFPVQYFDPNLGAVCMGRSTYSALPVHLLCPHMLEEARTLASLRVEKNDCPNSSL